eukprot:6211806-Pleurochrysis_carterae.AAC.2
MNDEVKCGAKVSALGNFVNTKTEKKKGLGLGITASGARSSPRRRHPRKTAVASHVSQFSQREHALLDARGPKDCAPGQRFAKWLLLQTAAITSARPRPLQHFRVASHHLHHRFGCNCARKRLARKATTPLCHYC